MPHTPSKCFYFCHRRSSLSNRKTMKILFSWFLIQLFYLSKRFGIVILACYKRCNINVLLFFNRKCSQKCSHLIKM